VNGRPSRPLLTGLRLTTVQLDALVKAARHITGQTLSDQGCPRARGFTAGETAALATAAAAITTWGQQARRRPPQAPPRARPVPRAGGRNRGPASGPRTLPMLAALAAAPDGLATPDLAAYASAEATWVNALGTTRQLMLKQQRAGRVTQAGTAAGERTRDSVIWRITPAGRAWVTAQRQGDGAR